MTDFTFRNPAPVRSAADIRAAYDALPMPEGWTRAADVALMEGLFLGLKLGQIGAKLRKPLDAMQDRFLALRKAAVGEGVFTLSAQTALLQAVRGEITA